MFNEIVLIVTIIVCAIVNTISTYDETPVVETPLGKIKGSILTTVQGKPIYSFRGIRYAKPPVNELRFQPPVPVDKWDDVYDATKDGPMCPQPDISPTSEDCLYVNVYTTKLSENGENPKRPVIVFIHFGGYVQFTGASNWIGPEYLLDQDIVFVTMNYRLGALGFINTEDEVAPGNNGVKDQVAALKWVKNNIASFGGDSDLVTLSGCSVGGVSVTMHLVSPMSKGLFHRAIAMSGSSYGNWPVKADFKLAQKQAQLVGCPTDTSTNIINCLKTKTAKELIDSFAGFQEFGIDPILVYHPVIEKDFGQERFLIDDPVKSAECGELTKVPVMTGITAQEFYFLALLLQLNNTLVEEITNNFEKIAPISFLYERDTDRSKHMSKELEKFYLKNKSSTESIIDGLGKLYGDSIIGFSINRVASLLARKGSEPVYYYKFGYRGPYSNFYKPGTKTPVDVMHLDDLIYLFYTSTLFPKFKETDPEYTIVKKMTTMWGNFAKTGKPIPEPVAELDNTPWTPHTTENKCYLDIGEKLVMKANLYKDRYDVWENVLPLPQC